MSLVIKSLDDIKTFFSEEFLEPIFFISPDPLWGIGLEKVIPNYHLVCLDDSPVIPLLRKAGVKVFCLEETLKEKNVFFRSSRHLLSQPEVLAYLDENAKDKGVNLIFFKQNFDAHTILKESGSKLKVKVLNNPASLNKKFEDKVSFFRLAKNLPLNLPRGEVLALKAADFNDLNAELGKKIVIQFGRGWAGSTTFFLESEKELLALKKKFPYPNLLIRVSEFIESTTLINNVCLTRSGPLLSFPFLQITGVPSLTPSTAGTCGNEWTRGNWGEVVTSEILRQTKILCAYMQKSGFKGYFGLDVLLEKNTGKIFISENNARLTASVPMYTKLELKAKRIPLLAYHLLEFLDIDYKTDYRDQQGSPNQRLAGAQLVIRNIQKSPFMMVKEIKPGVYHWEARTNLRFIREGYAVDDLLGPEEFLILPVGVGRKVNPGIEILRIQTLGSLLTEELNLKPQIMALVSRLKQKLDL